MFYENIWREIYKYISIIDFSTKQTFHCYINKVSYEAYKYELNERERKFLCMVCGNNNLVYHCCYDEDEHDEHDVECEDELEENSDLWCYSSSSYGENLKDLRWNICKSCKAYHNICICNTYRNLYSHPGEFFIGDPKNKEYKNEEKYRIYSSMESQCYTQEYIVNSNIKYFSTKLAEMTGGDGGCFHGWICKNHLCIEYNKIRYHTDK
jgi:hypothetical protein